MRTEIGSELLTTKEAAARLKLQEATIRAWILRRRIATVKFGHSIRIPASVIEQMITDGLRPAAPTAPGLSEGNVKKVPDDR